MAERSVKLDASAGEGASLGIHGKHPGYAQSLVQQMRVVGVLLRLPELPDEGSGDLRVGVGLLNLLPDLHEPAAVRGTLAERQRQKVVEQAAFECGFDKGLVQQCVRSLSNSPHDIGDLVVAPPYNLGGRNA